MGTSHIQKHSARTASQIQIDTQIPWVSCLKANSDSVVTGGAQECAGLTSSR